jgi:hypothetical protein
MSKYYIYTLFILAFVLRLSKLVPNMELVTTAMLLSSLYLSTSATLKLTFLLMAATDLVLGNTLIFIFTWSGFLLPIFVLSKLTTNNSQLKTVFLGLSSNLFFYLWTNFGVWFLDSWAMYPKTLPGLIHCYINGLPFLRPQLASTLLFLPMAIIINRVIAEISKPAIILDTSR